MFKQVKIRGSISTHPHVAKKDYRILTMLDKQNLKSTTPKTSHFVTVIHISLVTFRVYKIEHMILKKTLYG